MTKGEKVFAMCRKFDYIMSQKGVHFCDIVKLIYKDELEKLDGSDIFLITDDELMQRLKDVHCEEKYK